MKNKNTADLAYNDTNLSPKNLGNPNEDHPVQSPVPSVLIPSSHLSTPVLSLFLFIFSLITSPFQHSYCYQEVVEIVAAAVVVGVMLLLMLLLIILL